MRASLQAAMQIPGEEARDRVAREREQHYYFTLHDFEELVRQYGADKIIRDMNEEVYWMLNKVLTYDAN